MPTSPPLTVVVFGAAGQVGRAVVTMLLEAGHSVRAFDRAEEAWTANASIYGERPMTADYIIGDISKYDDVAAACAGCDACVHTAVYFPPSVNCKMPETSAEEASTACSEPLDADRHEDGRMWTVNLKGLYNVLEGARDHQLQRVVHLGSCHAENPRGVFNASEVRRPDGTLYAIVKRLQEECCRQHHEAHGTRIIVLRPDYVVDAALGIGRFGERLPGRICGRDGWVDRHDLADAVVRALTSGGDFDVLHTVHTTAPGRRLPEEVCNVARTRSELGWAPRANLDQYRPRAFRLVDCHSHAWPAVAEATNGHEQSTNGQQSTHGQTTPAARYPLHPSCPPDLVSPPSFGISELTSLMAASGVSRCVLVGHNVFHGADNSFILDACAIAPDIFRATAILDESQGDGYIVEQMRAWLPLGATSFRICPWENGKGIIDKKRKKAWLIDAMWVEAARSGQVLCCLLDPADLRDVSQMCASHPKTAVVLDHLARVGAVGDAFPPADVHSLLAMAQHPNLSVKLSAAYALGKGVAPYEDFCAVARQLIAAFGPTRLLWGSDCPYQIAEAKDQDTMDALYRASLDAVRSICDTPDAVRAICGGNAERLFFFDGRSSAAEACQTCETSGAETSRAGTRGAWTSGAGNGSRKGDDGAVANTRTGRKQAVSENDASLLGHPELTAVVRHLRALIAIPSINPDQADDPNGADAPLCKELRLANFLGEAFRALGAAEVLLDDSDTEPGRPNLYALFRASQPDAPWRAVDTHTDTVAIKGMASPFGGELTPDGRLHGRGSCDTKATFAILLSLLEEARESGASLNCNLLVCGTVGEETGRLGATAFQRFLLSRKIVIDELIVAEPTTCTPVHGHKGHVRLKFTLEGEAAHSSIPDMGRNAILAANDLIKSLADEHQRLQECEPSALGHATLTPTLVEGGSGINIVPPLASVSIDRRVVSGESASEVRAHLEQLARECCKGCRHCKALHVTDVIQEGEAFLESCESPLVQKLAAWTGREPRTETYGTNAGLPYGPQVAQSVVVFGPGHIAQAHQADEWISLDELTLHKEVLHKWLFT